MTRWIFCLVAVFGILFANVSEARADLIDITPPPDRSWEISTIVNQSLFFDDAAYGLFHTPNGPEFLRGWVSKYGVLNGGTSFFTDMFDGDPTGSAHVWWDFGGTEFWLQTILVYGRAQNGESIELLYSVPYHERFLSSNHYLISLPAGFKIQNVAFYGSNPAHNVPEAGTLALLSVTLGFGLGCLLLKLGARNLGVCIRR